jgi:hypothetical protein
MSFPFRASLTLLVMALSWIYGGGWSGLITLLLYAVAISPGLMLGAAMFGSNHAAGWTAGLLIGYGLLAFVFWLPIAAGRPGLEGFVFAWLMLFLLSNAARSASKGPLIALPEWTRRDAAALLLMLHLVPLIFGAALVRAAGPDDAPSYVASDGDVAVNLAGQVALTREVAQFNGPLALRPGYFLPAAVLATRGQPASAERAASADRIEGTLEITSLMTALALVALVYLVAWAATGRRWAAMVATAIAVLAASFEGLYALNLLRQTGGSLASLSIHAVAVGSLPRAMLWTPQHTASCGLGLIAVLAVSRQTPVRLPGILLTGVALGLSLAFNLLLGVAFCVIYAATILWDLASRKMTPAALLPYGLAAIPVVLVGVWSATASGPSATLSWVLTRAAPPTTSVALFLSLGGVLIPAAIGLLPSRHVPFRPAVPALIALLLGLVLIYASAGPGQPGIGQRAGILILVTVAMLVARGLVVAYHRSGRLLALTFAAIVFLAGVPTTAIEWYTRHRLP